MLFPVSSLCLAACLVGVYTQDGRRSALGLALGAWATSLLLASPIVFSYAVDYSLKADAYVAACLSAATGAYLLFRNPPRAVPSSYDGRKVEIRIATLFGVTGVLGCVMLLADARLNSGLQFSIGYVINNLSAIRTDQFAGLDSGANRGALGTIGGLIAPCAVLSTLAVAALGREAGPNLRRLAVIAFVLIASVSLMVFAGRATLVNLVIFVLISIFLSGRRLSPFRPRTLIFAAVLVICTWYLSTSFLGARERNPRTLAVLKATQRAEPRPWISNFADRDKSVGLMLISVGYFASPIPTLMFYTQQPPLPGPYFGAYSFQLPARVVGTANGTWARDERAQQRYEIFTPIEAGGYFGNVWATWLRDLLVDFGYFGSVLFCGMFGGFMAWVRNRHELTGALHYHYLEVLSCFTFGFGAFAGFMWDPFVAYPFFLAVAAMLIVRGGLPSAPHGRPAARPQRMTS